MQMRADFEVGCLGGPAAAAAKAANYIIIGCIDTYDIVYPVLHNLQVIICIFTLILSSLSSLHDTCTYIGHEQTSLGVKVQHHNILYLT